MTIPFDLSEQLVAVVAAVVAAVVTKPDMLIRVIVFEIASSTHSTLHTARFLELCLFRVSVDIWMYTQLVVADKDFVIDTSVAA